MRQSYYAVHKNLYDELIEKIRFYNNLLKVTFNKDIQRSERLKAMEDKEQLEEEIITSLKNNGQLLGFFTEKEFEEYEASLKLLSNETKELLSTNYIPLSKIECILMEFMQHIEIKTFRKFSTFLENAKKQDKYILVWIL